MVEDIWIIPESELSDLRFSTKSVLARLKKTDYYVRAEEIADSIYSRLDEITESQDDEMVSRERHIGIYRGNLTVIAKIKEDIAKMEKALATAGGPLAPSILSKAKIKSEEPSKTMTWIVIFIIIIFIGLLAAVLFFTWIRQARLTKDALLSAKKAAFPEPGHEEKEKPKKT